MNQCIQCNQDAPGSYCAQCGQQQNIPRLTFKSFFQDFFSRIYGLDGAMPRTLIGLSTQPGIVVTEYIRGIRKKYAGPVGYYFILFAVYLLLISVYNINMDDYTGSEEVRKIIQEYSGSPVEQKATAAQQNIKEFLFKNLQFLLVLSMPLIALWCKILFRQSSYNILENTVFTFYIQGHMVILNMIGITVFALTDNAVRGLMSFAGLLYFGFAASQFFTGKFTFGGIIKGMIAYIIAFLCFIVFVMLMGAIIGSVYSLFT